MTFRVLGMNLGIPFNPGIQTNGGSCSHHCLPKDGHHPKFGQPFFSWGLNPRVNVASASPWTVPPQHVRFELSILFNAQGLPEARSRCRALGFSLRAVAAFCFLVSASSKETRGRSWVWALCLWYLQSRRATQVSFGEKSASYPRPRFRAFCFGYTYAAWVLIKLRSCRARPVLVTFLHLAKLWPCAKTSCAPRPFHMQPDVGGSLQKENGPSQDPEPHVRFHVNWWGRYLDASWPGSVRPSGPVEHLLVPQPDLGGFANFYLFSLFGRGVIVPMLR